MSHTARSAKTPAARCAGAVAAATLALLLAPGSAAAASPTTFCTPGTAAGQCVNPQGVAVDNSSGPNHGDVYVADMNNNRVDVFDAAGNFLKTFGRGVLNGAPEPQVCTTGCQEGIPGNGPGELFAPYSLAVDSSAGPSAGDLYVFDRLNNRVQKFTPSGEFLLMFGGEVDKTTGADVCTKEDVEVKHDTCGHGTFGPGEGQIGVEYPPITVDSSGQVWIGDEDRLQRFGEGGEFLSQLKLPGYDKIAGLAVDPVGDFYVLTRHVGGENETQVVTYPASGTFTLTFDGETTDPIATSPIREFESKRMAAALEALPSVGAGNLRALGSSEFSGIEFIGALGFKDVEQITASAGASVETKTQGKPEVPGVLSKLSSVGALLRTFDQGPPFGRPAAFALDPASGTLFVSDQAEPGNTLHQGPVNLLSFDSSGAQTEVFGTGSVIGAPVGNALAFGAGAQSLYLSSSQAESLVSHSAAQLFPLPEPGPLPEEAGEEAKPVGKLTATLNASVNPEGASTTVHFEYVDQHSFETEGGFASPHTKESSESAPLGADFSYHPAAVAISGLTPDTAYRFRVVATNANGTVNGEGAAFTTEPPVRIDATYASAVSATAATLNAQLNPLGDAGEYRFEYLSQAEYEANGESFSGPDLPSKAPLPDASIGKGEAELTVSQQVQGLLPATAYRYRIVAHNPIGEVNGPIEAFATQGPSGPALPDGRGWELVSPPDKNGIPLETLGGIEGYGTPIQAAADGTGLAYVANGPIDSQAAGTRSFGLNQLLASRSASGWSTRDITTPHQAPAGLIVGNIAEYPFFSSDLSLAAVETEGATPLSPLTTELTPYLRQPSGEYTPLVTAENVPPGTKFGGTETQPEVFNGRVSFDSATPDLSHLVLHSPQALTAGFSSGDHQSLYEWSAGALELLSQIPSGAATVCGGGGPACVAAAKQGLSSSFPGIRRNAISADGNRTVFRTSESNSAKLFLRDVARGETLQLDAAQPGALDSAGNPEFQTASADGSRVFFTDDARITADSNASIGNPDLYMCQVEESAGHLACALTDLTVDHNSGEHANVKGIVIGASADGSAVYFVAAGVLAPGAAPSPCGDRAGETCNLYLYRDGTTSFIASLSGLDSGDWGQSVNEAGVHSDERLSLLTARVSPDGRWLAFMSNRPLTGYDNRDARSGEAAQEVYLYHAAASPGEAGSLVCASCNPTGARPAAVFDRNTLPGLLVDRTGLWYGQWLAASILPWTPFVHATANYQSRYLSNSGRLFFDAADALVPSDSNGKEDVYQYQPPGVGGCGESDPSFGKASGGCVDLISSGTSGAESAFLDASESGNDVFFLTQSKLAPQDVDGALDVYDAHVCSAELPCPPPPPTPAPACEGDACQQPAVPPNDPTPGSLTFQGAGNVPPPARKKHQKKNHRKRHHKRSHRRTANHGRRTNR